MFCPNCGSNISDNAKFCNNCGWKNNKVKAHGNILIKIIPIIIIIFVAVIVSIVYIGNKPKDTWITKNGKKYYYDEEGKKITNDIVYIDGKYYSFDANGIMNSETDNEFKEEIDSWSNKCINCANNIRSIETKAKLRLNVSGRAMIGDYEVGELENDALKMIQNVNEYEKAYKKLKEISVSELKATDRMYYENKLKYVNDQSKDIQYVFKR